MRIAIRIFIFLFLPLIINIDSGYAQKAVRLKVGIVVASNEGSDFNLVNDAYRDQLLDLFSYSNYEQVDEKLASLSRGERSRIKLPDGYQLILTLQDEEKDRVLVQALIRKDGRQYLDTVLSILKPGVVFVGGPPVGEKGALIIVLETGF